MNYSRVAGRSRSIQRTVVVALIIFAASQCHAGYKNVIGGITVTYSGDGAEAYYDPNDGTLTISVTESGGSLKVTAGPEAPATWGGYADVYILADNAVFKSIAFKGSPSVLLYLTGQVFYVGKFSLTYGVVGSTDSYPDQGVGMVS